jgi:hypothetical protein
MVDHGLDIAEPRGDRPGQPAPNRAVGKEGDCVSIVVCHCQAHVTPGAVETDSELGRQERGLETAVLRLIPMPEVNLRLAKIAGPADFDSQLTLFS